jgi:hypothetical protein
MTDKLLHSSLSRRWFQRSGGGLCFAALHESGCGPSLRSAKPRHVRSWQTETPEEWPRYPRPWVKSYGSSYLESVAVWVGVAVSRCPTWWTRQHISGNPPGDWFWLSSKAPCPRWCLTSIAWGAEQVRQGRSTGII